MAGADGQDIAEYYHPSITTLEYPRVGNCTAEYSYFVDMIDRKGG